MEKRKILPFLVLRISGVQDNAQNYRNAQPWTVSCRVPVGLGRQLRQWSRSIVATWPTVNSVSELESPVKYRGDPAPGRCPPSGGIVPHAVRARIENGRFGRKQTVFSLFYRTRALIRIF